MGVERPIIDIETLEVYPSGKHIARVLNVSRPNIRQAIILGHAVAGRHLEYLEEWGWWTDKQKEKWTRKNGIYFVNGDKL